MLERLLALLREGGARTYPELAKAIGVSEELLDALLEDLSRMGYIKPVAQACEGACANCPMSGVCAVGERGKVWTLTAKGNR